MLVENTETPPHLDEASLSGEYESLQVAWSFLDQTQATLPTDGIQKMPWNQRGNGGTLGFDLGSL
jgi:hypothetical protein